MAKVSSIRPLTAEERTKLRELTKKMGVAGCAQKTHLFTYVGKQCHYVNDPHGFVDAIEKAGFYVDQIDVTRSLCDKRLLDSVMVAAYVS